MIDFRYHLVSIVSIFLALAVGIALGAGPLKGELGDQLEGQIKSLSSDKSTLNAALSEAKKATDKRDQFMATVNKRLLAGLLGGATITIVTLPGADGGVVKSTTATLTAAGAKIGATVSIKEAWTDPQAAPDRATAASDAASALGQTPATPTGGQPIDGLAASSLLGRSEDATDLPKRSAALKVLSDAKLLSVNPNPLSIVSTYAVVISGPVSGGSSAAQNAAAQEYAALTAALDAVSNGAVLGSNIGVDGPTSGVSVVSTVRANGDIKADVSTVDDLGIPMGQASLVLALLEQLRGGAGQYGLGADAGVAYPVLQGF
ncbi:MAG: copper transporter [Nostocoides sp.]